MGRTRAVPDRPQMAGQARVVAALSSLGWVEENGEQSESHLLSLIAHLPPPSLLPRPISTHFRTNRAPLAPKRTLESNTRTGPFSFLRTTPLLRCNPALVLPRSPPRTLGQTHPQDYRHVGRRQTVRFAFQR